jgi:surfeit locus 1 family protein
MALRRSDVVGWVVALVAAALCVRLGFWQLSRLHQRRARNEVVRAALARPPLELAGKLATDSVRDRRVHARGIYDFDHQRLWRPRSFDDMPGVDLVTPLKLADGSAVLVDRGWVPSADAYHVDERVYREPDSADFVGLALDAPRSRGDVDPATLRDSLPYPLSSFVVQQLPGGPVAAPVTSPRRWPAPELTDGPHLSYVIQWFSFAVIIVVGSVALFRKTARAPYGRPGRALSRDAPPH